MKPYTKESCKLFIEGVQALARVECNGIKIDTEYLDNVINKTKEEIIQLKEELKKDEIMKVWKEVYKNKININSSIQLSRILFDEMGHTPKAVTATGKPKTDEKALSAIDLPFIQKYLKIKKLEKARTTYLKGIRNEVVNGFLHPSFNLHTTQTFRSSSDSPNFQNIPIRDEVIGKMIRTAFIARPGRCLIEIDYSGIEVRIATCYHKDPVMLEYINDPSKDMHRDMAVECYKLKPNQVTKKIRYCGKNMFVFPQFYGDWYLSCARSLWEAISTMNLETEQGVPLQEHLKSVGIKRLGNLDMKQKPEKGTFELHLQQVENRFWKERFAVYDKWKKNWYDSYVKKGWLKTKTGFVCQGFMKRNQAINYPIQGSAFHCLLWSLIQLVKKELPKRKMKTLIVGQIHDSIIADVPKKEVQAYLEIANEVMTQKLKDYWDWIITPLDIEAERTPINGSWAEKKEIKF